MSRQAYVPQSIYHSDTTTPPKVYDMKYYSEYPDPYDDEAWAPDHVLFSFTFDEADRDRSPAFGFLIEIQNIETGVIKSFIQLADKSYYRFWERGDEIRSDYPIAPEEELKEESIVNGKVKVIPFNDFGSGEPSTFFLPFKDMIWTRAKDNQTDQTFATLSKYWHLFSETPDERVNRPKTMYIYLDTPEPDVEDDRVFLNHPQWEHTTLTDYKYINDRTYRWLITEDADNKKLTIDGWKIMTSEEDEFIENLVRSMLPSYRDHVAKKGLSFIDPFVLKVAVENPKDNKDTIIIYLIKKTRWHP
jgi:hypothetical protein